MVKKFLSKEEELSLGEKIQNMIQTKKAYEGKSKDSEYNSVIKEGTEAIRVLVENNVKLVYDQAHIYKRAFPAGPELEDLIQSGMIGLMKAVYKFDPSRKNKFSTVATTWIMQSIRRETNNTHRLVRLPENRINEYTKINRMKRAGASDKEVMEELGLNENVFNTINSTAALHYSLNAKIGKENDDSSAELIDIVFQDELDLSTEEILFKENSQETLSKGLESLSEIQKDVLFSSFAISEERMSRTEVKKKYKLSHEEYEDILRSMLESLRSKMESNGFTYSDFLDK